MEVIDIVGGARSKLLFSKFSCASLLIYIGTLPIIFQRILISISMPCFCSLFGLIITLIVNFPPIVWIILSIAITLIIICSIKIFYNDVCIIFYNFGLHTSGEKDKLNDAYVNNLIKEIAQNELQTQKEGPNQLNVSMEATPRHYHNEYENSDVYESELQQILVNANVNDKRQRLSLNRKQEVQKENLKKRLDLRTHARIRNNSSYNFSKSRKKVSVIH